eukprot:3399829-Ditylum_brightwellii.AAC.1
MILREDLAELVIWDEAGAVWRGSEKLQACQVDIALCNIFLGIRWPVPKGACQYFCSSLLKFYSQLSCDTLQRLAVLLRTNPHYVLGD